VAEAFGGRWTLVGGGALTLLGTLLATLLFMRREGLVIQPTGRVVRRTQPPPAELAANAA
jgi:hypothetical protein